MALESPNFLHLQVYDAQLVRLGTLAEKYFTDDPVTCLIKLRQFGEVLAQLTAAKSGLFTSAQEPQVELLRRLRIERVMPAQVGDLFHDIRQVGNKATHDNVGNAGDALNALKYARVLGIWFHQTFGPDKSFNPGPFVPPTQPEEVTEDLSCELARLKAELDATRSDADRAKSTAEENAKRLLSAEALADKKAEESAIWEQLAAEAEANRTALESQLQSLQATAQNDTSGTRQIPQLAQAAASNIQLDEAATRNLIDQQLRNRGWTVDSVNLRYHNGTRPVKGQNMAIAEWPTSTGPVDYALFVGTKCLAVVEAKRQSRNVSNSIDQAERYAKSIALNEVQANTGGAVAEAAVEPVGGPWDEYKVPYVFATNGRAYLQQLETESGIWFRDTRKSTNRRRAVIDWYTPAGLLAELDMDREKADADLSVMPFNFGFDLRSYQQRAIEVVEQNLKDCNRQMLLAMATGTGKTKLAIAMLYRLLHTKRFKRVCFIVDRSALGQQAAAEFKTTKVVTGRTFADTFGLKELADIKPDDETKVHICTIQGLLHRVLLATDPADVPAVDQYDLLVVDECHRGYLLDRELSDAELQFRSQDDYISKYRRALEHFDAVKIGLTATPALHTVEIFGEPVYTYSYRDAVVDGYLIDHEPPLQIQTRLSRDAIIFNRNEEVQLLNTRTGGHDLVNAPDELRFEVESFNRKVITTEFNKVVAGVLAQHVDPSLPGKTLVFAVTDAHADILVEELKTAFENAYGEIEDNAVRKITGSVDRVREVILKYRNDAFPKVAVTVDLLTTGIDVPSITNLLFVRRVNSRILYEQMLGRATRRCDEIGKETFRIFDAVGLYESLESVTSMKPVVVNQSITFTQLFEELQLESAAEHVQVIIDQIIVKLRRAVKKMPVRSIDAYQMAIGESAEETIERLRTTPPREIKEWASTHKNIGLILDWRPEGESDTWIPISNHADELISVTSGYGNNQRPEDYLQSFESFVRNNVNDIMALNVVVQRPRELTRTQLKELRLALDRQGFSEVALRRAWDEASNKDVAASIIGFVRQAALGDPLIPYEDRVRGAIDRLLAGRAWTEIQRKWLKRIGAQFAKEFIVDRESIDSDQFKIDTGGFKRLDKVFDGKLESVLADFNEELWRTGT